MQSFPTPSGSAGRRKGASAKDCHALTSNQDWRARGVPHHHGLAGIAMLHRLITGPHENPLVRLIATSIDQIDLPCHRADSSRCRKPRDRSGRQRICQSQQASKPSRGLWITMSRPNQNFPSGRPCYWPCPARQTHIEIGSKGWITVSKKGIASLRRWNRRCGSRVQTKARWTLSPKSKKAPGR